MAERLRIARELHDVVAHHLSVVVIQAQGAQRTIGQDPGRAMAAMTQVEQTGRTALEEMRGCSDCCAPASKPMMARCRAGRRRWPGSARAAWPRGSRRAGRGDGGSGTHGYRADLRAPGRIPRMWA